MSEKYDGWIVKNKWGSLLKWTFADTRRETIAKTNRGMGWDYFKRIGCKIVKVRLVEVE